MNEYAGADDGPDATTVSGADGADGRPQAHCPAQDELVATQPGPRPRLQQDFVLTEPQQDMPRERNGWRGAA